MGIVHCIEKDCEEEFDLNDVPGPIEKGYFPMCAKHATELHLRPVPGHWKKVQVALEKKIQEEIFSFSEIERKVKDGR